MLRVVTLLRVINIIIFKFHGLIVLQLIIKNKKMLQPYGGTLDNCTQDLVSLFGQIRDLTVQDIMAIKKNVDMCRGNISKISAMNIDRDYQARAVSHDIDDDCLDEIKSFAKGNLNALKGYRQRDHDAIWVHFGEIIILDRVMQEYQREKTKKKFNCQ